MFAVFVRDEQGKVVKCQEILTTSGRKKFQCPICEGEGGRLRDYVGSKCPICDTRVTHVMEWVEGGKSPAALMQKVAAAVAQEQRERR
jgi:hypothetical protein